MTLVPCSVCGQSISEESLACPLCRAPRGHIVGAQREAGARDESRPPSATALLTMFAALVLLVVAMFARSRALVIFLMLLGMGLFVILLGLRLWRD